jgi:predicted RecB family nuclease
MTAKQTLRTCAKGHAYYKSSNCPTCPTCETLKQSRVSGFLSLLASPARRALEQAGISTIEELADRTEKEILQLHGMGKASLPILRSALAAAGHTFKAYR